MLKWQLLFNPKIIFYRHGYNSKLNVFILLEFSQHFVYFNNKQLMSRHFQDAIHLH